MAVCAFRFPLYFNFEKHDKDGDGKLTKQDCLEVLLHGAMKPIKDRVSRKSFARRFSSFTMDAAESVATSLGYAKKPGDKAKPAAGDKVSAAAKSAAGSVVEMSC